MEAGTIVDVKWLKEFIRQTIKQAEKRAMLRQRNYDQKLIEQARQEERESILAKVEGAPKPIQWDEQSWAEAKHDFINILKSK